MLNLTLKNLCLLKNNFTLLYLSLFGIPSVYLLQENKLLTSMFGPFPVHHHLRVNKKLIYHHISTRTERHGVLLKQLEVITL